MWRIDRTQISGVARNLTWRLHLAEISYFQVALWIKYPIGHAADSNEWIRLEFTHTPPSPTPSKNPSVIHPVQKLSLITIRISFPYQQLSWIGIGVSTNPDEISCAEGERRKSSIVRPEVESKPEIEHKEEETKQLQPQPAPVIHLHTALQSQITDLSCVHFGYINYVQSVTKRKFVRTRRYP